MKHTVRELIESDEITKEDLLDFIEETEYKASRLSEELEKLLEQIEA